MSDNNASAAGPFRPIADEFVEALRQGQSPSAREFARRYPAHADEIREMPPALMLMEKAAAADDTPSQRYPATTASAAAPTQQPAPCGSNCCSRPATAGGGRSWGLAWNNSTLRRIVENIYEGPQLPAPWPHSAASGLFGAGRPSSEVSAASGM
jgi:hypothetical protein